MSFSIFAANFKTIEIVDLDRIGLGLDKSGFKCI